MFYRMYLSSVCHRRQWPEPHYEQLTTTHGHGHLCKVRVNNREYQTDCPYQTPDLARDAAAMKAWMICRNFSHNDGMAPGQRPGGDGVPKGAVVQGLPAPIGAGRRGTTSSSASASSTSTTGSRSGSDDGRSRDTSPRSLASPVLAPAVPPTASRVRRGPRVHEFRCRCARGVVHSYGRCEWCLREAGWA